MSITLLFAPCAAFIFIIGFCSMASCTELKNIGILPFSHFASTSEDIQPSYSFSEEPNGSVEATVINPFQVAGIGAEVSGTLDKLNIEEGDFVNKGDIIAEVSRERYALLAEKASESVRALELDLERLQRDEKLKQELLSFDASTKQELLKTQAEKEIVAAKLKEATAELKIATLNLKSCTIRAPFSGYVSVIHKQQFEPVERLEKVASLIDSSKVYAVANVGEHLSSRIKKGTEALFVDGSGNKFRGQVAKIAKVIDPKSKTKKIYLLLDNAKGKLEAGMTGSLQLVRQ